MSGNTANSAGAVSGRKDARLVVSPLRPPHALNQADGRRHR